MDITTPRRMHHKRTAGAVLENVTPNPRGFVLVSAPSRFRNPLTLGQAKDIGYDNPRVAAAYYYRTWLDGNRRDTQPTDTSDQARDRILDELHTLRGKDLACTCPEGETCHADYLLNRANLPTQERAAYIARVRLRVDRHRIYEGHDPLHPELFDQDRCRYCTHPPQHHGRTEFTFAAGDHPYSPPTDEQRLARLRAHREGTHL